MQPFSQNSLLFLLIILATSSILLIDGKNTNRPIHSPANYERLSKSILLTNGKIESSYLPSVDLSSIVAIRGGKAGVSVKGKKPIGILQKIRESLQSIERITRSYLLLTLFCTVVHLIGLPAPKIFALDVNRIFEIWRPFTSISYFGAPSMSMANSMYFLIRYGQTLEKEYGSGTHAWFLLLQTIILTALGFLLQFPFQSQAMIAAIVYVSSRLNAMEQIPFQFGLLITSWQLPFCMMIIDCLSQQNVGAAWPHILGIFSGHVYYFFTEVWPKLGGKEYLKTPSLFIEEGKRLVFDIFQVIKIVQSIFEEK
eukprot:gene574-614_t